MTLKKMYEKIDEIINMNDVCQQKIMMLQELCYEIFIEKENEKAKEWENGFKKAMEITRLVIKQRR